MHRRDFRCYEALALKLPARTAIFYIANVGAESAAPGVPTDASNLVLKAAAAWRAAGGRAPRVRFELEKRTPAGAGMGGCSVSVLLLSNCCAALNTCRQAPQRTTPRAMLN